MAASSESKKGALSSATIVDSDEDIPIKPPVKKDPKEKGGIIKLKRPAPKHSKPGNWRDGSVVDDKKTKGTDTPSTTGASPGPVVNQLDDSARESFPTGRPLEDNPDLQRCKHCKKLILKTALKSHITACLKQKKEAAQRKKEAKEAREKLKEDGDAKAKNKKTDQDGDTKMGDDDDDDDGEDDEGAKPEPATKKAPGGVKSAKKSAGKKTDADGETKKGKKRKADGDAEKAPKQKKKKDEPKPKAPKQKGPVDVERQCGVITPNGLPCARSLTCKSHSMGAKRAVPGRSLPYDMLLTAYQKKNQAKQQKAALDANAPLEDEDDANAGPVDSDEETSAVMAALSRWVPKPVAETPVLMPLRRAYQLARLREQIDNATAGHTINIFKVSRGPYRPVAEADGEDAPGEVEFIAPASRRPSGTVGVHPPGGVRRPTAVR